MNDGDGSNDPDFLLTEPEAADVETFRTHPLVKQIQDVDPDEDGGRQVGVWLREPTAEESEVDLALEAKPDRPPEIHVSGLGLPPAEFWDLFPGIASLLLREEHDTGWWEAQIWLRPA
jgi:hypothetical protein